MKPENLTKINRELDGEDYDLNALVEYVVDKRADGRQSENIYTKRLRKQRDVAVSLLLDQSSSTARTITRNPLQPYHIRPSDHRDRERRPCSYERGSWAVGDVIR